VNLVARLTQRRLPLYLRHTDLRKPWDTWLYWSPPKREDGVRGHVTRDSNGVLLNRKVSSKIRGTWQRQSPPQQGGCVRSCGTRDDVRALLDRETGSRAVGHVTALDPFSAKTRGLKL
jgi:hypothetical protein